MKIVFLAKHKLSAYEALAWLVAQKHEVVALVAPEEIMPQQKAQNLFVLAQQHNIPIYKIADLYAELSHNPQKWQAIDLVISFLFWQKIKPPLLNCSRLACINFHPAPLPDFRGLGGYNFAIYENLPQWGVSAHWVDANFDTGDLIKVNRFPINANEHTCQSLEAFTQQALFELFTEVMQQANTTGELPRLPQNLNEGRYINKAMMENLKKVDITAESWESIERKIRACWFPPYLGAYIEVQGQKIGLVSADIVAKIVRDI